MFKRVPGRGKSSTEPPASQMSTGLFPWLGGDKAPLYATLFFAALAWTFVRTIDQLAATPFVEYHIDPHSKNFPVEPGQNALSVQLHNMTGPKPVSCLIVYLAAPDNTLKFNRPFVHRLHGPVFSNGSSRILDEQKAEILLTEFPPGGEIEFGLSTTGQGTPIVQVKACNIDLAPLLPNIVERSFQTWLISRQLPLLWLGLVLWAALLLAISAARLRRHK